MKKLLHCLLTAVLATSLIACGGSSGGGTATSGDSGTSGTAATSGTTGSSTTSSSGTAATTTPAGAAKTSIRVGDSCTFQTLSPFAFFTVLGNAQTLAYECLGYQDLLDDGSYGEFKPYLAKEWTTNDNGVNYQVTIYDNIYDQKGNHITADDVVFCYNESKAAGNIGKLKSISKIDDYTVNIELVDNMLSNFQRCMGVPIVSQKEYEATGDGMSTTIVSTSPWKLKDYVSGSYITFENNLENYWQKDESLRNKARMPKWDEITFVTVQESAQMTIGLETGNLDAMVNMSTDEIAKFLEGGQYANDFEYQTRPLPQVFCMMLSGDESSPFADDLNLRLAVMYAVDSDGLVKGVANGYAETVHAMGNPMSSDYPETGSDGYFDYNPDLAKEYLAKSNYDGRPVRVMTTSAGAFNKFGQIICNYLNAVGIQTELLAYENALYQTYFYDPTQFDIGLTCTAGDYVVNIWTNFCYGADKPNGKTTDGWYFPDLDEALSLAAHAETHTQENVEKACQLLNEKAIIKGFFRQNNYHVYRKDLGITHLYSAGSGTVYYGSADH